MSALSEARKKAGMSQKDLAGHLGLTQSAVAHYESGRRVPSLDACRRIVAAFNAQGHECGLEDVFPVAESKAA